MVVLSVRRELSRRRVEGIDPPLRDGKRGAGDDPLADLLDNVSVEFDDGRVADEAVRA